MNEIQESSSLVLEQVDAIFFVFMRDILEDFENSVGLLDLGVELVRPHRDLFHRQEAHTLAQRSDLNKK